MRMVSRMHLSGMAVKKQRRIHVSRKVFIQPASRKEKNLSASDVEAPSTPEAPLKTNEENAVPKKTRRKKKSENIETAVAEVVPETTDKIENNDEIMENHEQ